MWPIATEVTASPSSKDAIADRLAAARQRTFALIEPLDDEQLNRVYSPLLSPLAWDLGHIANFEELWLVQTVGGREPLHGELGRLYDAIENPRRSRNELPILRDAELRSYLAEVRERALEVLDEVEIGADAPDRLLREGFVYEMLIAHELQHNETMLQLLMMVDGYELPDGVVEAAAGSNPGADVVAGPGARSGGRPAAGAGPSGGSAAGTPESEEGGTLAVTAGEYEVGAPARGFAYDNERPRHAVELAAFEIDAAPVTNGEYAAFVEETGAEPPLYWERDGDGWVHTAMGRRDPVEPDAPVIHVSWHEADAFARHTGMRLPTEFEWEAAFAAARSAEGTRSADAQGGSAKAAIEGFGGPGGPKPFNIGDDDGGIAGTSGVGLGGAGHAWEWTASDFTAYPGFEAFPYREYSEAFFGDEYKVLRGGAWATGRELMRPSFRNWDLPQRRQIFAGFRRARSLGGGDESAGRRNGEAARRPSGSVDGAARPVEGEARPSAEEDLP